MKPPINADSRGWTRGKSASIGVYRRFLPSGRYEASSLVGLRILGSGSQIFQDFVHQIQVAENAEGPSLGTHASCVQGVGHPGHAGSVRSQGDPENPFAFLRVFVVKVWLKSTAKGGV